MAETYRAAKEKLRVILKNKKSFEEALVAKEESAKQYNAAKAEIQKCIYDEIGNHIEGYYEISQSLKKEN